MAKANQKHANAQKKTKEEVKLPDPCEIKFEISGMARAALLRVMPTVKAQIALEGTRKVMTRKLEPEDLNEIGKRLMLEWVRASDPATRY